MSTAEAVTENSEFVTFWNEILVPKFVKYRHILVDGLTHHSAEIIPTLQISEGDKVVDVACGFGDTAIQLADRAGPSGSVLGIDCCDAFLDFGRKDASAAAVNNVTFVAGDALNYPFESNHDFCFSRFGTMFFENPVVGLRNMRTALKPGGIMTMIVWRALDENPWLSLPKDIVLRFLPAPGDDARTCGPGPFSMADPDTVTLQLEAAGYEGIELVRVDAPVIVGDTLDDAIDFQLALGPAGEVFREAGDEAEEKRADIVAALKTILGQYETEEGVMLASSSWKVTARNPG